MTKLLDVFKKPDPMKVAIEEYNSGLAAKYRGEWAQSLVHNQHAAKLNPNDEATWWNLAIAATALRDWPEARRAWLACGVNLIEGEGEVLIPECWGCVRLNPNGKGEVVWGRRIDPARMRIQNVPLPESDRRYGDIVLNDGAPEGTRTSRGKEYSVFNELGIWQRSTYSTYDVEISLPGPDAKESLDRLCTELDLAFEDWGTLRHLCAQCSRGNPGPHECDPVPPKEGHSRFGFAARGRSAIDEVLRRWLEVEPNVELGSISLAVSGISA
jgi:hypothetical protein